MALKWSILNHKKLNSEQYKLFDLFRQNAEFVSAKVKKIKTFSEAVDYSAALVNQEKSRQKIIAAPEFTDSQFNELQLKEPEAKIIKKDC